MQSGARRGVPVDQLVGIEGGDLALLREGEYGRVECDDFRANGVVGQRNPIQDDSDTGGCPRRRPTGTRARRGLDLTRPDPHTAGRRCCYPGTATLRSERSRAQVVGVRCGDLIIATGQHSDGGSLLPPATLGVAGCIPRRPSAQRSATARDAFPRSARRSVFGRGDNHCFVVQVDGSTAGMCSGAALAVDPGLSGRPGFGRELLNADHSNRIRPVDSTSHATPRVCRQRHGAWCVSTVNYASASAREGNHATFAR